MEGRRGQSPRVDSRGSPGRHRIWPKTHRAQIIGLYKTKEAAGKAKKLMRERGIPDRRTSLPSPDDTEGVHLATYLHHRAASVAWLWAACGGAIGGLLMGAVTAATVEGLPAVLGGHLSSALIGVAIVAPIGGASVRSPACASACSVPTSSTQTPNEAARRSEWWMNRAARDQSRRAAPTASLSRSKRKGFGRNVVRSSRSRPRTSSSV